MTTRAGAAAAGRALTMAVLSETEPIVRRTLHDELVSRLRAMITDGDLAAGIKVPEKALCETFGVSRTPLREALKVLASEGLVTLTPNRGARIAAITEADLEEVFPVMAALEALAGELAAKRIGRSELAAIRRHHQGMLDAYARGARDPYHGHNQEIHRMILEAADNATLNAVYSSLAARVRRSRFAADMSADHWARAVAEHEEILAAIEARDGKRLGDVLRRHVATKWDTVRAWLEREAGAGR